MTATTIGTSPATGARPALLRPALKLDAAVTGANGLAYLALAGPLDDLLGLSPGLLRAAGAFLIVFTIGVLLTASRRTISRAAVEAIVAVNVAWATGSIVVAIAGWESPTAVGTVWLVLQALVVGAFAVLQFAGLRARGAEVDPEHPIA